MSAIISAAACCKAWYEPIRLAELFSHLRIFYRHLKRALSSAERIRGYRDGGNVDQTIINLGAR
jgi:hypothetical protein